MLAARRNAEALEEDQEDKEIVDAERDFDGVSGDKFERGLMAFGDGNPCGEAGCGGDQKCGPEPGYSLGAASLRRRPGSSESATSRAATVK
jgi:hypothetical protein